nr:uroporphyrinogen-III synthase [Pseudohoeflea sp. DP4N28-3]
MAQETADQVRGLGFEPVVMPLFAVESEALPAETLKRDFSARVVSSRNGADRLPLAGSVRQGDVEIVYAVGAGTAEAVALRGYRDVRVADGTGASLAELICRDVDAGRLSVSAAQPLHYLAGSPRKPDIEADLAAAGVPLVTSVVYRMREISYSTDYVNEVRNTAPCAVILLYSANAARRFTQLFAGKSVASAEFQPRLICISEDVARFLPAHWRGRTVSAGTPSATSMLESLASMR